MYNSSNVANRIKFLAKSQGIVIKEMLEECELSKNALSTMTSSNSMPKSENLAKIADYLECSVDFLLGRTDNPQLHKDGNYVSINDVSGDSNNFIGNGASGDVTINNSVPQTSQETALINIFKKLDDVKRAKILTYADNLNNDIDILYADNLVPYCYASNKAILAGKEAVREIDNFLNRKKIHNAVMILLNRCCKKMSYVSNFSDDEKNSDMEKNADYSIFQKIQALSSALYWHINNNELYHTNSDKQKDEPYFYSDSYSKLIRCRNDLAELVGIYKR